MYKTRSRFMQHMEAGVIDKIPRMKYEGPEFRLTVCLKCTSVRNVPNAKGNCQCGGKIAKVDGPAFLGQAKFQLVNEFRKRLGILKKGKREKSLMMDSKIRAHEVSILILPRNQWSPKLFREGIPSDIRVRLIHLPSGIGVEKVIEGRHYHANLPTKNLGAKNLVIAEELCSELEVALGYREHPLDYFLERHRIPGTIVRLG